MTSLESKRTGSVPGSCPWTAPPRARAQGARLSIVSESGWEYNVMAEHGLPPGSKCGRTKAAAVEDKRRRGVFGGFGNHCCLRALDSGEAKLADFRLGARLA